MVNRKRRATHQFTRWSDSYDRCILQWMLFAPSHRAIFRRVHDRFGSQPIRVLDVGCGTGVFAVRMRQVFPQARICGMDLTAGMLAKGQERWSRCAGMVDPVQGDAERLPFAAGAFDVVTCANSFHHYPHQDRAVSEMHRVLKPGGQLLLVDGYRDGPWGWVVYDLGVTYFEGDVHHASRFRMRELFSNAGFEDVNQEVHRGLAPFLLTEGLRPETPLLTPHLSIKAKKASGVYESIRPAQHPGNV